MPNTDHFLYYWKNFETDMSEGKVGWLGTKMPAVFRPIKEAAALHKESWLFAVKVKEGKSFPLAILRLSDVSFVKVDASRDFKDFLYYDPDQSYALFEPEEQAAKKQYFLLGERMKGLFPVPAVRVNFVGANGIAPISSKDALQLLSDSREFRGKILSTFVGSKSWAEGFTSTQENDVAQSGVELLGEVPAGASEEFSVDSDGLDLGQGYEPDAAIRKLIELHAVDLAQKYYESAGYAVKPRGKPFDLLCKRGGEEIHVEVKGTRGNGRKVIITKNERDDARDTAWRSDLFIVYGIVVGAEDGEQRVIEDGTIHHIENWLPQDDHLETIAFRYSVPMDKV